MLRRFYGSKAFAKRRFLLARRKQAFEESSPKGRIGVFLGKAGSCFVKQNTRPSERV